MDYHDEYALMMYNEQIENILTIVKHKKINQEMNQEMSQQMSFDRNKLAEFKIAFNEAKKNNEHYFMFDGQEFFLGYAKYAIEYLENEFNKKPEQDDKV